MQTILTVWLILSLSLDGKLYLHDGIPVKYYGLDVVTTVFWKR